MPFASLTFVAVLCVWMSSMITTKRKLHVHLGEMQLEQWTSAIRDSDLAGGSSHSSQRTLNFCLQTKRKETLDCFCRSIEVGAKVWHISGKPLNWTRGGGFLSVFLSVMRSVMVINCSIKSELIMLGKISVMMEQRVRFQMGVLHFLKWLKQTKEFQNYSCCS